MLSILRPGYVNGLPCIARLSVPSPHPHSIRVQLASTSQRQCEAKLLVLEGDLDVSDDDMNLGMIRALGKDEVVSGPTVYLAVWARGEEEEDGIVARGAVVVCHFDGDALGNATNAWGGSKSAGLAVGVVGLGPATTGSENGSGGLTSKSAGSTPGSAGLTVGSAGGSTLGLEGLTPESGGVVTLVSEGLTRGLKGLTPESAGLTLGSGVLTPASAGFGMAGLKPGLANSTSGPGAGLPPLGSGVATAKTGTTTESFEWRFPVTLCGLDTQELVFGDCVERTRHVREFTIRNFSDCKLCYRVDVVDYNPAELLLTWYEDGTQVEFNQVHELNARSVVRVHATLTPNRPLGDRTWKITVENTRNSSNVCRMSMRANVLADSTQLAGGGGGQSSGLEIYEQGHHRPTTVFSFGDACYANSLASKRLIIRNTNTFPVDLSLVGLDIQISGPVSLKESITLVGDDDAADDLQYDSESEDEKDFPNASSSSDKAQRKFATSNAPSGQSSVNGDGTDAGAGDEMTSRGRSTSRDSFARRMSIGSAGIASLPAVLAHQGRHNRRSGMEERNRSGSWGSLVRSAFVEPRASSLGGSSGTLMMMGATNAIAGNTPQDVMRSNKMPVGEVVHIGIGEEKEVIVYYLPSATPAQPTHDGDVQHVEIQVVPSATISSSVVPAPSSSVQLAAAPLQSNVTAKDGTMDLPSNTNVNGDAAINPATATNAFSAADVVPSTAATTSPDVPLTLGSGGPTTLATVVAAEKWKKSFRHSFRLQFSYPMRSGADANIALPTVYRITKTVWAEARVCVSIVSVSPSTIRFGDCLLNQKKTTDLTFSNQSDAEAQIKLQVESTALNVEPKFITIEPRGQAHAMVTFLPTHINLNFVRDIVCTNLKNPENNLTIKIHSSNVDPHHFAYHSFFYKLVAFDEESDAEVNFLNWPTFFFPTPLDGVCARRVRLRNLKNRELGLSLKGSSEEIEVFAFDSASPAATQSEEEFFRTVRTFEEYFTTFASQGRRKVKISPKSAVDCAERNLDGWSNAPIKRVTSIVLPPAPGFVTLILAFRPSSKLRDTSNASLKLSSAALTGGAGVKDAHSSGYLVYDGSLYLEIGLTNPILEDFQALREAMRWTFKKDDPSLPEPPTSSPMVSIPISNSSVSLSGAQSTPSPLGMILGGNVDPHSVEPSLLSLLRRKLPLRATIGKSVIKLSQTRVHFGTVDNAWERRSADVTLSNSSALPLIYKIERGHSALKSSCVDMQDDMISGLIRPFEAKSLKLHFVPRTWRGKVEETLLIRNLLDGSKIEIRVKADILIPEHFRVEIEEEMDFGPCFPGMTTNQPKFLALTNTTKKSRDLFVQVSLTHGPEWPKSHLPVFCFQILPPESGGANVSASNAEQTEVLEHQLRIAMRKGDMEKVAKVKRKLAALTNVPLLAIAAPPVAASSARTESPLIRKLIPRGPLKGSVVVTVPPESTVRVAQWLHVRLMTSSAAFVGRAVHLGLRVFERKQGDQVVKEIPFACTLFADKPAYLRAIGSSSPSLATRPTAPRGRSGMESSPLGLNNSSSYLQGPVSPTTSLISNDDSLFLPESGRMMLVPSASMPPFSSTNRFFRNESGASTFSVGNMSSATISSIEEQDRIDDGARMSPFPSRQTSSSSVDALKLKKHLRQIDCGSHSVNSWFTISFDVRFNPPPVELAHHDQDDIVLTKILRGYYSESPGETEVLKLNLPEEFSVNTRNELKKRVTIRARYTKGGRHSHVIMVLTHRQGLPGEITLEKTEEIVLKGAASFIETTPDVVDFGNVIVVPEEDAVPGQPFTFSIPLRRAGVMLRNTHVEPVLVTAESNSNQILVYSNSGGDDQVDRVLLEAGGTLEIFVSFRPTLLSDAWRGVNRFIKEGVMVSCNVGSEDDRDKNSATYQSTISLLGIVGMSVFSVTEQRVPGSIRITNASNHFPLRVELKSETEDVRFSVASPELVEIPPLSDVNVSIRSVGSKGLCFRNIFIRNLDSGETVRLASTSCALSTNEILRLERGFGVRVAIPIKRVAADTFVVAHDAVSDEPVRVRNISETRKHIVMKCGFFREDHDPPCLFGSGLIPLSTFKSAFPRTPASSASSSLLLSPQIAPSSSRQHEDGICFFVVRAECTLEPGMHKDLFYRFPNESRLKQGSFRGWLSFETIGDGGVECAAAVRFLGEARISHFELDRKKADAGEIGAFNGWVSKSVEIVRLTNADHFVPADVEISVSSPRDFLQIISNGPRLIVEPGGIESVVTVTIECDKVRAAQLTHATDFEFSMRLVNTLNPEANEFSLPIKIRICPKLFVVQKGTEELRQDDELILPDVIFTELSWGEHRNVALGGGGNDEDGISVNEWISLVNSSSRLEAHLEAKFIMGHGISSDVDVTMFFRATGAAVPSSLTLEPAERLDIRVVLRCERGCSLRGDVLEFGRLRFACGAEEHLFRVRGRISGPPILRALTHLSTPPSGGSSKDISSCKVGDAFTVSLTNDSNVTLQIVCSSSDPAVLLFESVAGEVMHLAPCASRDLSLFAVSAGQARLRFECINRPWAGIYLDGTAFLPMQTPRNPSGPTVHFKFDEEEIETSVEKQSLVSEKPLLVEDALAIVPSIITSAVISTVFSATSANTSLDSIPGVSLPSTSDLFNLPSPKTSVSLLRSTAISGCTSLVIPELRLYELDAGILTDTKTYLLSGVSNDAFLIGPGKTDWISLKRPSSSNAATTSPPAPVVTSGLVGSPTISNASIVSAPPSASLSQTPLSSNVQLKLNPNAANQSGYNNASGGFFAAYLVVPGSSVVRVKIEVMDISSSSSQVSASPPLSDNEDDSNANLALIRSISSSAQSNAAFEVSPPNLFVPHLFWGRTSCHPFTLYNRHPKKFLVFQLTVFGLKNGLSAWFSLEKAGDENRRVTIAPRSCTKMIFNVLVGNDAKTTTFATDDLFSDLELNVTCRHLRDSRVTVKVSVPRRPREPKFALSAEVASTGDIIRVDSLLFLGPNSLPDVSVAPFESILREIVVVGPIGVTCDPEFHSLDGAPSMVLTRLTYPGSFKLVQVATPGFVTVYDVDDPSDRISVYVHASGTNSISVHRGFPAWRDAVENELARACLYGRFMCPADVVFRELIELLSRDSGGRGAALTALWFALKFLKEHAEDSAVSSLKKTYEDELKNLPEFALLFSSTTTTT